MLREKINYAHRGASAYAPENTFAAFDLGLAMGANGIETDIQRTRDGTLVLYHDDTLQRLLGVSGSIADRMWDELRGFDLGQGTAYSGEKIPLLSEFLERFGEKPIHLALELKQPGIEADVLRMLQQYRRADERTVITSFHWQSICCFHELAPSIQTGFLTDRMDDDILQGMKNIGISQFCPRADTLSQGWVHKIRSLGFTIRPWGVATPELMKAMVRLGVDGMTVNFPDLLTKEYQMASSRSHHTNTEIQAGHGEGQPFHEKENQGK